MAESRTKKKLMFRYANPLDLMLMMLGSVFGVISGLSLPLIILVFGYTLDEFVNYNMLDILQRSNYSIAYFCTINQTVDQRYLDSSDTAQTLRSETLSLMYYTLGLGVIVFISNTFSRLIWAISASQQAQRMRLSFLKSVLTRQIGWYDINSIGEIPSHFSNCIPQIEKAIGQMSTIVQDATTFLACFIIALSINWELTLVTSVLLPIILVIVVILGKIIKTVSLKRDNALSVAEASAYEVLSSIKTVMAFGGQDKEIERYCAHLKDLKKHSLKILVLTALTLSFLAMMILQYFALGFWYASELFVDCKINPGEVLVVVMEVMLGTFTLAELFPELKEFLQGKASAEAVFEIIDQESEIDSLANEGTTLKDFKGSIRFTDVNFTYPKHERDSTFTLQGLDLDIKPGQTVALVGPSGCGKSTIMKLIPRIYEYNGGNITVDGRDIRSLNVNWLRSQISVVSQEPVLFNVSIAENIGYGKEGATREEIEAAAKAANAHDFITTLPDGYNTIVGEGGSQISGGQKQRIAIARALVHNPKILLLDEATSALDTRSEKAVQVALDKAKEGRTTIIIAHRLSTIRTADVIVGIDKGCVVEMGSHSELMEKNGLYHRLVNSQSIEEPDGVEDEEEKDFTDALMQSSYKKQSSLTGGSGGSLRPRVLSVGQHYSQNVRYRSRSGTMGSNGGLEGSLASQAEQPQVNIEYGLRQPFPLQERQMSIQDLLIEKKNIIVVLWDILVLSFTWVHWFLFVLALVVFVLAGGLFTYNFAVLKELVEQFERTDRDELLEGVIDQTIQFALIGVFIFILYIIGISAFTFVGEQVVEKVREKSFMSMVKKPLDWFDEKENSISILTYNLATQANDIFQLFEFRMGSSLRSFVTVIGVMILTFQITWVIAFVLLPAYFFMFVGAALQVVLTKKFADRSKEGIEQTAQITIEFIENVYTVTTLSMEQQIINKYKELLEKPTDDNLKSAAINGMLLGGSKAIVYTCVGISYIVGAHIITADRDERYYADLAEIFTVIAILILTSRMFKTAFNALPDMHKAVQSAEDVIYLVQQPAMGTFGWIPEEDVNGKIQFQNVHFYYPTRTDMKILRGLKMSVEPGKTLALVGPSGSGKSTVLSLVERFYGLPRGSSVLLDGNEIQSLRLSWLRQQMSLVSQEPVLFEMSIADNIRYGAIFNKEVSDEEIQEAAKSANIHEFILSLEKGYETVLKGTQLSGGQKQRIAIARALIRNPKILLLDEATSALDTESERIVQEALEKARKGRTTIVIAHRLSTIQNADSIAVLHKGRVIEQGTHSELMSKRGAYFKMHATQKQEFLQ